MQVDCQAFGDSRVAFSLSRSAQKLELVLILFMFFFLNGLVWIHPFKVITKTIL